jgi:hypothetical protein
MHVTHVRWMALAYGMPCLAGVFAQRQSPFLLFAQTQAYIYTYIQYSMDIHARTYTHTHTHTHTRTYIHTYRSTSACIDILAHRHGAPPYTACLPACLPVCLSVSVSVCLSVCLLCCYVTICGRATQSHSSARRADCTAKVRPNCQPKCPIYIALSRIVSDRAGS